MNFQAHSTKTGNNSGTAPRFGGMIAPETLISLVEITAPFLREIPEDILPPSSTTSLIDSGNHPFGFIRILRDAHILFNCSHPTPTQQLDYFALCLACHHATVATYVPTDVDSKIRGTLWEGSKDPETLRCMFTFSLAAMNWNLEGISKRFTDLAGVGPVSGHNGEMLGVLAGALGAFLKHGLSEEAEAACDAIDKELEREAKEFNFVKGKKGLERQLLAIAGSLTHNIGDLDQGISYWPKDLVFEPYFRRFADFNHSHVSAYQGAYALSLKVYKALMASEGHRHYPLREVKALRQSPTLLMPLGPYLDDWGATVAISSLLTDSDKVDVLSQLLQGCKKIAGQTGYYRAIAGMAEALGGRFSRLIDDLPKSSRALMKERTVVQHLSTSKASFEGSMAKKIRALL
jgi:hypothetical protein